MAGKLTDAGENRILNQLFEATAVDTTLYLRIYTDPATEPLETAVLGDLTEPVGSGYAAVALTRDTDWTVTLDEAVCAQKTFTAAGGAWGNCYGYYISTTSDDSGVLMFVEQFSDGPYNIVDTASIKVTPKVKCA